MDGGDLTPDLTPKKAWIPRFLAALAEYGNVLKSAKKARISRSLVYLEREANADFRDAWDAALKIGTEALEDEARRRAYEGALKPVFQGGAKVGAVREYSDTLMIFLLKAHKPERYRDTSRILNVTITAEELARVSDDDLDELERKLAGSR